MARKRGKLSLEEEQAIRQLLTQGKSFESIAAELNRTTRTIRKYCDENDLTYQGMSEEVFDETLLLQSLKGKPYWAEVEKQFSREEQEYFAITWVKLMKQLREDVLYSEELTIKQWISLEIMANTVLENRKKATEQIDRLQQIVDEQYRLSEEHRDVELLVRVETELSMLRNSQSAYTTEYDKILGKIERYQRELKAARADRVKRIEDSKSSFAGFLKSLEDEDIRRSHGEEIEINRIAMEVAKQRLSEWHEYEDGQVDQPFLTPETVKDDHE